MRLKDADEGLSPGKWVVLDARRSKEELMAQIRGVADKVEQEAARNPIAKLWSS